MASKFMKLMKLRSIACVKSVLVYQAYTFSRIFMPNGTTDTKMCVKNSCVYFQMMFVYKLYIITNKFKGTNMCASPKYRF